LGGNVFTMAIIISTSLRVGKKICGIDQLLKEMYDMKIRDETMDNNDIMLNWYCYLKLREFMKKVVLNRANKVGRVKTLGY
jgi:hypothetical protein